MRIMQRVLAKTPSSNTGEMAARTSQHYRAMLESGA
jgi:hypothetical protein